MTNLINHLYIMLMIRNSLILLFAISLVRNKIKLKIKVNMHNFSCNRV